MNKNTRNILLISFLLVFSGILCLVAIFRIPAYVIERSRLKGLQARLDNQLEVESQLKAFREGFSKGTADLRLSIGERLRQIEIASFSCLPESEISSFVEDLQKVFSGNGVNVDKLAYKTRQISGNLVTLPFEASCICSYSGMRKLLHSLETNPAGISIDLIEFLQLDFKGQGASIKITGSARFKKVGS